MGRRSVTHGAHAVAMVALMLAIVVLANLLANRRALRRQWDLTEERLHTIPEESLNVVRRLEDVVNVTVYLSEDLPGRLRGAERQLRDKLAVYADQSRGRLKIEFVDPLRREPPSGARESGVKAGPAQLTEALAQKGIEVQEVPSVDKDSIAVTRVFMSLEVQSGDRSAVVTPLFVTSVMSQAYLIPDFEYAFTVAVKKVSQKNPWRIGLVCGIPNVRTEQAFASLVEALKKQFDPVPDYVIHASRPIRRDLDVLILLAPAMISDAQLYQIDQFVMNGGRLLALMDRIEIQTRNPIGQMRDSNVLALLEHWGVRVNPDMVLDRNSCVKLRDARGNPFDEPQWVVAPRVNLAHPVVAPLPFLALSCASSLTLDAATTGGARVQALIETSPAAWTLTHPRDLLDLRPFVPPPARDDACSTRVVAAAITGPLSSYYASRPVPAEAAGGPDAATPAAFTPRSKDSQIIIVGDADFLADPIMKQSPDMQYGGPFIGNALDWMTSGEDLIGIRLRGRGIRRLNPDLDDATRTRARLYNTIGLPALLMAAGIVVLAVRRARRRRLAAVYGVHSRRASP